jgi:2-polyprenyl-3-methyl-5-hydroxy-6-metoxy-1,4-benzoquinol methylase
MERPSKAGRAVDLFNLGIADFNKGRHGEALANLRQAAVKEPGNATYASFYGQALYHTGDLQQAREFLARAAGWDPDFVQSWKYLGLACRDMNDSSAAAEAFAHVLEIQPADKFAAQLFMENFSQLYFDKFEQWTRDTIHKCLQIDDIDHQIVSRPWADFFMMDPATAQIRDVSPDGRPPGGLNESYLNLGLQRFYVCSMPFERVMMRVRHLFLNKFKDDLAAYQTFLCSLATQMWLNEYIYVTTPEEEKNVAALKTTLEQKAEDTPQYIAKLCLYGCYAPLLTLSNAKDILQAFDKNTSAPLQRLLHLQITEPLEEQETKKNIKRSGKITDDVSVAVQAQYEQNPYPRWRHVSRNIKTVPDTIDVLIAGCGTGMQTALCAALYPNARIHNIDLSLSSLAYAVRQTKELGFKNLTFEQADILNFEPGGKKYELIECVGVLHHMKDPDAGLKALLKHLKPGGKMWLGLYSAIARADIAVLRRMIANKEIKSEDLRSLRQEIADHPDTLVSWFIYKSDFFTTSSCCDLIWHAQEYHYTLPEIEKLLSDNGLEFGEFYFTNPGIMKAFRTQYGEEAGKDLQKWHEFEQKNPALFAGMYMFTVSHA